MTTSEPRSIDRLDVALVELLAAEPRVRVLEASRRLGVARGTVQARLRMQERRVTTGYRPEVDPAALGYAVTTFITLEIRRADGRDRWPNGSARSPRCSRCTPSTYIGNLTGSPAQDY
jgi:DNA-binding Lrp family transcriptional regulator